RSSGDRLGWVLRRGGRLALFALKDDGGSSLGTMPVGRWAKQNEAFDHAKDADRGCGGFLGGTGSSGFGASRLFLGRWIARAPRDPDLCSATGRGEPAGRSLDRFRHGLEQDGCGGGQVLRYRVGEPVIADDRHSAQDRRDPARTVEP